MFLNKYIIKIKPIVFRTQTSPGLEAAARLAFTEETEYIYYLLMDIGF